MSPSPCIRGGRGPWPSDPAIVGIGEALPACRQDVPPPGETARELPTTLMLRNLPRTYDEAVLLQELEAHECAAGVNFVFVPRNRRLANASYAFVNTEDGARAGELLARLQGRPWLLVPSPLRIRLKPAHVQGLAQNLAQHLDSPGHKPTVLHEGWPIAFQRALAMYVPFAITEQHHSQQTGTSKTVNPPVAQVAAIEVSPGAGLLSNGDSRNANGVMRGTPAGQRRDGHADVVESREQAEKDDIRFLQRISL